MENLIVAIVLYVAIVAVAYRPKPIDPVSTIEYFPELEEPTEPEPKPVATFQIAKPQPVKTTPENNAIDLSALSIRELKKMASAAKIKRYSAMTKAQLIQSLT